MPKDIAAGCESRRETLSSNSHGDVLGRLANLLCGVTVWWRSVAPLG